MESETLIAGKLSATEPTLQSQTWDWTPRRLASIFLAVPHCLLTGSQRRLLSCAVFSSPHLLSLFLPQFLTEPFSIQHVSLGPNASQDWPGAGTGCCLPDTLHEEKGSHLPAVPEDSSVPSQRVPL